MACWPIFGNPDHLSGYFPHCFHCHIIYIGNIRLIKHGIWNYTKTSNLSELWHACRFHSPRSFSNESVVIWAVERCRLADGVGVGGGGLDQIIIITTFIITWVLGFWVIIKVVIIIIWSSPLPVWSPQSANDIVEIISESLSNYAAHWKNYIALLFSLLGY
jgi:hypothetical protein